GVVVLPVEALVDDDALRDRGCIVRCVELEVGVLAAGDVRQRARCAEVDRTFDRLRVRVEQELARVEAMSFSRRPWPVHPVRVALPRSDARDVAVPVERSALAQVEALLVAVVVERSEEHTSELQSRSDLVCRLLLEKKKKKKY